jgi:predicted amidohydrolase
VKVSTLIAQFPVGWDIEENVATISGMVADARRDDVVVLPEGALSGYGPDLSVLDTLDHTALARAVEAVADLARRQGIHLFCGSLL